MHFYRVHLIQKNFKKSQQSDKKSANHVPVMVEHQMLENVVSKIGLVTGHFLGKHSVGRFGATRADLFILNLRLSFFKIGRLCAWRPSAAIPAAQFHTLIKDESVPEKILSGFGRKIIFGALTPSRLLPALWVRSAWT